MDDANGEQTRTRNNASRSAKKKYMDILQDIADRKTQEICIELDDLVTVRES